MPAAATAADHRASDTIVGHDGKTYPAAPPVVDGRRGDLFHGLAYDLFCSDAGPDLRAGMKRLSKLTGIIRASGREVVFTIVPDKGLVNESNVIRARLPHGRCDKVGMAQQRKIVDTYADRTYLPLRKGLAADKRQTYWKTDVHWNTIGASVYAKLLAARLDPALGKRQRYKAGAPQTAVGYLNQLRDDDTPETVPSVRPATGVKVKPRPGTDSLDGQFPFDHEWTSGPAKLTHPGRALLLGDSFSLIGLVSLRPLFARGQFLWVGNVDPAKMARAVEKADTVVIEVVQFFTTVSPLGKKSFRKLVGNALH